MADLTSLTQQALGEVAACGDLAALDDVRVRWLGKKGTLTEQLKALGGAAGRRTPRRRRSASTRPRSRSRRRSRRAARRWSSRRVERQLAAGRIDVTLPGRGEERGGLHPVTQARLRIETLFRRAGFDVAAGPEIEDDFHNFEALNIPANHPARAMHDTFYFPDGRLLRTHTSPVQIRAHAGPGRAARHHRARARLSLRLRHDALADVPPARGPGGRREHQLRQHEGGAARLPAGVLRAGPRDAAAALVLPVHRALGRSRHVVRVLRGQGLPRVQARPAGSRSPAAAWCIRTCCARAASIPSATPASPSAWASTGSRCCAMA